MGRAGLRGRERRERSESKLAMCLHVFWSARELESCTCVLWRPDDTCGISALRVRGTSESGAGGTRVPAHTAHDRVAVSCAVSAGAAPRVRGGHTRAVFIRSRPAPTKKNLSTR